MGDRSGRWFNCQRIGGLLVLLFSGLLHAGTVTYVYTDPQGTVLAEADANGNITARYDYTPYGTAVASMSPAPNGPGYTGHVNDPDTGLVYMQARYYDPTTGRFLSADPINPVTGNLYNFNRYGYANNNPVNNTDPDGRCVDADFSCGAMARSFAQHPEATKPLVPYAVAGVGVMATASGAGAAVVYVKTAIMVDKVLSESPTPPTTLQKNVAQGKAGEALTRAKYGDHIAGEQVTIKTSDGTRTRTDFVTKDRGVIETKTGGADLSKGQAKLFDDINAGREVTPVGKNATDAGLESGKSTVLKSCTIDRC
ncbi:MULTISPECIES: RHS repeat-associated core domain-containing protein [unclassified Rhodanobacter]|uniref:RHS repeat-associated core domain-containing protein n=1 Tax=unclassified Rhodanobacter TaxID=2621553 RepID=UPI001BDF2185|nr:MULTISPECIES: RHS repeat-associated core domain-containing protein [unclassified Rhodanobacter]MBT2143661.1 RHS repeat-associated core domain-containing protein [Rhodanobacter sp. LX-99]MBT2147265.1 RHS repeat-associated core domain-containing protein [Rhodanobacter sp. LX-100]